MLTNKKWTMLLIASLGASVLAGCSGDNSSSDKGANVSAQPSGTDKPRETPYLEVWAGVNETVPIEKTGKYSQFLVQQTGVGIFSPVIPWEGGNAYIQKLNTRIASANLPDIFLPWNGNEATLIKQGAVADLTDYLPKYAPNIWKRVPEDIWNVVRSADPSGKGRIYYIPWVNDYTYYGSFIRQDWLDNLGLQVPKTKDEYVNVLRAFRDKDANGNGDPNDEIPVSGREHGRWMDHLFGMYGVAMWEGFPMWHEYDGQLTYSAVTPNMKAAIQFVRELYAEKLLDQNTFLNQGSDWLAGIHSDKIGSWFHINQFALARMTNIVKANPKVKLAALGVPKVDGYEGFISNTPLNRPQWLIADKGEQVVIDALKLLDWAVNEDNLEAVVLGVEGMHYEQANGKPVLLPVVPDKTEVRSIFNTVETADSIKFANQIALNSVTDPVVERLHRNRDQVLLDAQPFGKTVAGGGIPATIYEGYADIRNHTLFQEYMTKIVIGEYPIEKFDEFVQKWHQTGGEQVTQRAREWYKQVR